MAAAVVSKALGQYLNLFLKGFDRRQLDMSLFQGEVTLTSIRAHIFPLSIDLSLSLSHSRRPQS